MQFSDIEFLVFFFFLICLFLICRNNFKRRLLLLCACYFFYACWDYRFILLIFFQTTFEYYISRTMYKSKNIRLSKSLLFISILINVGILFYFKYFNWFINSFSVFFHITNEDSNTVKLILPIGISFYTFRLISYSVDVFKKNMPSAESFIDFAIYVSFFPIIISGPIARPADVLYQIKNINLKHTNLYSGLRLFIIGVFLKIFVADNIGMFVNFFYENHLVFNSISAWIVLFAYSLQIYADFAGYSSMAIGISCIIGIHLEDNFNYPYLSLNIKEFWKKWHISLSSWIRDYIYIPLGGSRKGRLITYVNLVFTMILCGLWHGAGFNYIFWGFLHGIYLVINDLFSNSKIKSQIGNVTGMVLTFFSVSIAWIFFRAETFDKAIMIIKKLVFWQKGILWCPPFIIFLLFGFLSVSIMKKCNVKIVELNLSSNYTLFILFCMIWLTIVFSPKDFQPFVYAQF